jgi:hypothetical protein
MTPDFYGGVGKMEVFYGEKKTFQFFDRSSRPLAGKTVTLTTDGITQQQQTDAGGRASFDIFSTRHFKLGDSLENGGTTGTPERTDYREYAFSGSGYYSYRIIP